MIIRLAVFIFALILILLQCFADSDSASLDGSFPLKNGIITIISDYNRMDQCMAEPGYFHMHHNSLVIFLEKHQFCGGGPHGTEGFLSCYKGQLDENETMRRGLKPDRQFELKNVPGNAVAKRCEEAGHSGWHGMLIYTNDQGEWVIKFSTTNRTFVIPGKSTERPELLFYKLASAKDGGESFLSKIFGPKRDFMEWSKLDGFGVAEEAANRIRQPENEQLKKLFMELVKHQALLRNYVGIWSLGLDMLPTDENVYHLELYTEKSECCQAIQTFFNLPTAEYPDPKKEEVQFDDENNGPIVIDGNFVENYNGTLDGIVKKNPKYLAFELVDLLHPSDKDQGMRLIVDFGNSAIIFERMENKIWKKSNETKGFKYHFGSGVAFHLFYIMRKNELIVNMNCYGPVQLIATEGGIDFNNIHRIKIDGDFQLTQEFFVQSLVLDNSWMISNDNGTIFGISADNSSGIVLRGKVDDKNVKNFSIKLWTKGGDGFFETIFELKVDIMGRTIQYSDGSVFEDAFEKGKQPQYNEGSPFEVLVQFKNETFDIWMDNSKIRQQYDITAGYGVVNYVQILGDASGDLIELPKVPIHCAIEMSKSNRTTLSIVGKMLPGSIGFTIVLNSKSGGISAPLSLKADSFNDDTLNVLLRETNVAGNLDNRVPFNVPMKIGEDFHLKIQYGEVGSEILITINEVEKIFESKSGGNFLPTDQYSIIEDIIILEQFPPCVPTDPLIPSTTPKPESIEE